MSEERFLDRFIHFRNEPHQIDGVRELYAAIKAADPSILQPGARWVRTFSPRAPKAPSWGSAGWGGSEEAGMKGPGIRVLMAANDTYLIVNDRDEDCEAYDHQDRLLWRVPGIARGTHPDWTRKGGDTPPGLYKLGKAYMDWEANPNPAFNPTLQSYGWCAFDMIELEGQEVKHDRAGIMLHGGGTACGWPGAWAPRQALHYSLGCIRMHNEDLQKLVLPAYRAGTVYVGVFQ